MVEGPDGIKIGPGCLKRALQQWRDESIQDAWKDS